MASKESKSDAPSKVHHICQDYIGGNGGQEVGTIISYSGNVLEKIGVWAGQHQLKSIKFWWSNGSVDQFGKPWGPYKEHSFQPGEFVTKMTLSKNDEGDRLGAISFHTSHGKHFYTKETQGSPTPEYPIDTGSGIILAVKIRSGDAIDALAFVFLKEIVRSRLFDVKYPNIDSFKYRLPINTFKSTEFANDTTKDQVFTLESSMTMTTKESWSSTVGLERASKITVEAGIPKLAFSASLEFSLTESESSDHEMENTIHKTEKFVFPIDVPAKSTVTAKLSMRKANISLEYTGRLEFETIDKGIITFPVTGVYNGVEYDMARLDLNQTSLTDN